MGTYKSFIVLLFLNVCLSLLVVFISPRFDLITLLAFLAVNLLLFFLLILNEQSKEKKIKKRINELFSLLEHLDTDSQNYEVFDDELGKLRDEIVKIIVENRNVADHAIKNGKILREYTEDIAHQIKTPLTGLLLILDLMEEDRENVGEYIKRLRGDVERLSQLAELLLKLASLDSGIIQMKREQVPIKALINDVITDMELYFDGARSKIPVHGEDFVLICDKRWTYEAIFNVVKNGVEVSKDRTIEIHLKETNVFQSILVEDFSAGLERKLLEKVYMRFYKVNPNSKGYGIGLPMAKSVMQKQNGELLYVKGKSSNTFELRFYK